MTISDRTRKIVWVEAAGRCAACKVQVLTAGTDSDDPSIFGEEAHIVGRSPNGPRGGGLPDHLLDSHENLLLLCSKHHKAIDDQTNYYTVDRLREIKRDHKLWAASLGSERPGPLRVVPDPRFSAPKALAIIFSGSQLWPLIKECVAIEYAFNPAENEDHEDLIIEFLDTVKEYGDIAEDLVSVRDERDAQKAIDEYIKRLAGSGFLVGATMRRTLLTGGASPEGKPWPILTINVQQPLPSTLVDSQGQPLSEDSIADLARRATTHANSGDHHVDGTDRL